ncbi:hypothetical protein KYB31_20175 [Clostridium felsineum]|nr:hypothetical protein [Clostridium felsineum]MCR3761297.1 hypothetical protein [Clostridium felsineum]
MESTAAPTYFKLYRGENDILCIDSGIGANNPTFLGVAEAIGVLEWPIDEIQVLSLGCTEESCELNNDENKIPKGQAHYAAQITDLFMKSQDGYSDGLTRILLRVNEHRDRYVRINQKVSRKAYALGKVNEITIKNLKGLATSAERKYLSQINGFFKEKAEKFEPIYKLEE